MDGIVYINNELYDDVVKVDNEAGDFYNISYMYSNKLKLETSLVKLSELNLDNNELNNIKVQLNDKSVYTKKFIQNINFIENKFKRDIGKEIKPFFSREDQTFNLTFRLAPDTYVFTNKKQVSLKELYTNAVIKCLLVFEARVENNKIICDIIVEEILIA